MDTDVFCNITNAHTDAVRAQRRLSEVSKVINRRRKIKTVGYVLVLLLEGIAVFGFIMLIVVLLYVMRLVLA